MDLRDLLGQQFGLHEEQTGCEIEDGLGQDSFVHNRKTFIDQYGVPVTVGTVSRTRDYDRRGFGPRCSNRKRTSG